MAIPVFGTLFATNESSSLLDEARRKRFRSKVVQLLYLDKGIRVDILIAVAFLTTKVTKNTEKDGDKLLRVLKYIRGTPSIRRKRRDCSGSLCRCIACSSS